MRRYMYLTIRTLLYVLRIRKKINKIIYMYIAETKNHNIKIIIDIFILSNIDKLTIRWISGFI